MGSFGSPASAAGAFNMARISGEGGGRTGKEEVNKEVVGRSVGPLPRLAIDFHGGDKRRKHNAGLGFPFFIIFHLSLLANEFRPFIRNLASLQEARRKAGVSSNRPCSPACCR